MVLPSGLLTHLLGRCNSVAFSLLPVVPGTATGWGCVTSSAGYWVALRLPDLNTPCEVDDVLLPGSAERARCDARASSGAAVGHHGPVFGKLLENLRHASSVDVHSSGKVSGTELLGGADVQERRLALFPKGLCLIRRDLRQRLQRRRQRQVIVESRVVAFDTVLADPEKLSRERLHLSGRGQKDQGAVVG